MQPGYIKLWQEGALQARAAEAAKHYEECFLCPRACGVQRSQQAGTCRAPAQAVVASFGPHYGEERVLVGRRGSGTVFFSYCSLGCVFCQNHDLSFAGAGRRVSAEQLGEMLLTIQNRYRCPNVNLVTPTHFVPSILSALVYAVERGFSLPLVYNCGGYEKAETLELLAGVIDIYMPDYKYALPERGERYSAAPDYPQAAQNALLAMDRQVGGLQADSSGIARKGLLIRHLMLPGGLDDTKQVLKFIAENLSSDCLVNLMSQYYPHHQAHRYPEIGRRLTVGEYTEALSCAKKLGLRLA